MYFKKVYLGRRDTWHGKYIHTGFGHGSIQSVSGTALRAA